MAVVKPPLPHTVNKRYQSSNPNGTLSYDREAYSVKIGRILYGMEIRGNEDFAQGGPSTQGYASHMFYTRQVFQSTFSLELLFSTFEEKEDFTLWAVRYMKTASDWRNREFAPYMRIQGPRGFDFTGILTDGPNKNYKATDVAWAMNLTFRGGQQYGSSTKPVTISSFVGPNSADPNFDSQSLYFYPSDMNVNASIGSVEDSKYNPTPVTTVSYPGADPYAYYSGPPPLSSNPRVVVSV